MMILQIQHIFQTMRVKAFRRRFVEKLALRLGASRKQAMSVARRIP